MQPYTGSYGNPRTILEECRKVNRAIDQLDGQLNHLQDVYKHVLARSGMPIDEINGLNSQIIASYSALVSQVKNMRLQPESGSNLNALQVNRSEDRLKEKHKRYKRLQEDFERDSRAAAERQYRIVRPDATDDEVREAVADPDTPIFQQAVCVPFLAVSTCPRSC